MKSPASAHAGLLPRLDAPHPTVCSSHQSQDHTVLGPPSLRATQPQGHPVSGPPSLGPQRHRRVTQEVVEMRNVRIVGHALRLHQRVSQRPSLPEQAVQKL